MEDPTDTTDSIVETRQEFMVSPTEHDFRTAHFLRPSAPPTSIEKPPQAFLSKRRNSPPPEVSFHGWLFPQENWKIWVERMSQKHRQTWQQAGIYEAIMGSTNKINKYPELVLDLATKWSPETNTFAFRFAETTITLEDIMLCGGYSVLGCPVFDSPEGFLSIFEAQETREKEEKLNQERSLFVRSKQKKATQYLWTKRFVEQESEVEHEAFLTLWLSRFVFPGPFRDVVSKHLFRLAIRLARGTRIALAPAVLASIYRDLSYLHRRMFSLCGEEQEQEQEEIVVWAPFQLVLVWIWERFVLIQPERNWAEVGETRMAQWHKVKMKKLECEDMKPSSVFDSSGEFFTWRPYAMATADCVLPKFYGEKEEWLLVSECLDEVLELFVRCLRASELVGIDSSGHFVEQYLPHRVARQFGLDQDIPGRVIRCNRSHIVAWRSYNEPVNYARLYIPSRFFIPGVSASYFEWWNDRKPSGQDGVKPESVGLLKRHREECGTSAGIPPKCSNRERLRHGGLDSGDMKKKRRMKSVEERDVVKNKRKRLTEENKGSCSVRSRKSKEVKVGGSNPEDELTLTELFRSREIDGSVGEIRAIESPSNVEKKENQTEPVVEKAFVEDKRKRLREENDESCPPRFSQKYNNKVEVGGSDPGDESTLLQKLSSQGIDGSVNAKPLPMMEPLAATENKRKRSREDKDAFCCPGFSKKCNKVEVGGSDLEDKWTLTQMLRSQRTDGSASGSHLPALEPVEEEVAIEDKTRSGEERLNDNGGDGREEVCEFDLYGVEKLQARIAKLENLIDKMREARRGKMLWRTKKTKVEHIDLD